MTKDKQKANKPLNPFVPLVLMVLACAIVSYFVIPGAYDRETEDGVTRVLADSYHATERIAIFCPPNTSTLATPSMVVNIGSTTRVRYSLSAGVDSVLLEKPT